MKQGDIRLAGRLPGPLGLPPGTFPGRMMESRWPVPIESPSKHWGRKPCETAAERCGGVRVSRETRRLKGRAIRGEEEGLSHQPVCRPPQWSSSAPAGHRGGRSPCRKWVGVGEPKKARSSRSCRLVLGGRPARYGEAYLEPSGECGVAVSRIPSGLRG